MSDAAEMAEMRKRFQRPSPSAAAYQALTILATNGYLLYLLLQGEASPTGFTLYGVLELVAWSIIANLALIPVPKDLRVGSPDVPLMTRIVVMFAVPAFLLVIALTVVPDREHVQQVLHTTGDPLATLDELHILWPLLASIAMATIGSIGDLLRWRQTSGPFVTGTSMAAASKFLTAIVGVAAAALIGGTNALLFSIVYLVCKSGFELLMLWWQFLGMPERQLEKK
jgi:hypothetical protein